MNGAIESYTKAVEVYPQNAEAYYHRGAARRQKGDYSAAYEDLTKAIKA
ncbi:MAG TPA: tetratricopeptide repeat protein [Pyrinomonadaceae bacterium]